MAPDPRVKLDATGCLHRTPWSRVGGETGLIDGFIVSYCIFLLVHFTQGTDGLLGLAGIIINDYGLDHSLIPDLKHQQD